ncbi:MAG: GNAT family N-acetyltransferase [Maritimibacter sp.]|nr:GNAT family N-acetyltransferase [Maritimibacter sp.]
MTGRKAPRRVAGPNLVLRLVDAEDAVYVHGLRVDPTYNRHLSEVRGDVEDQRRWIETYKMREARGEEVYYIVERHDGTRCGTVRLYDIEDDGFTWGSWILDVNKPRKAALESAVLSFGVGFIELNRDRALVDVRIGNTHAEQFYRRLGMVETHRSDREIYFVYPRDRFVTDRAGYLELLEKDISA